VDVIVIVGVQQFCSQEPRGENRALQWYALVSPPHHCKAGFCNGTNNDCMLLHPRGIIMMAMVWQNRRISSLKGWGVCGRPSRTGGRIAAMGAGPGILASLPRGGYFFLEP